jgi:hypothetical protein
VGGQLPRTSANDTRPWVWLAARLAAAREPVLFACSSAALILYQVGYGFEVGDQLQYLLLPYREIFPDFLPGDWFTWQTSHYHETFAWIVRALASTFGTARLPQSVFALHTLNLVLLGYALWQLACSLGFRLLHALFAVCGFALVRQMGLAGSVLNHGMLVPSDLALPPFLLACAAHARGSRLAMGAWLGLSGFMHANYAVLGPVLLFGLELLRCRQRRELMQLVAAGGLFVLLAFPNLRLVLSAFLIRDAAPEAVAVTLLTRSPHHYDLRSLRVDEFYYAFGLGLLTLPYCLGWVGAPAPRRTFLRLTAGLCALIALSAVGSLLHITALSRLFTWRMSIPLFALWLFATAAAVDELGAQRRWLQLMWAAFLCVGLGAFAQTDPLEQSPWTSLPRAAALAGALSAASTLLALAPWRRLTLLQRRAALPALLHGLGALLALAAAVVALSVTRTPLWQGAAFKPPRGLHWLDGKLAVEATVRPLTSLVQADTPLDARFLIPPGMSSFRMGARRSIFVDWKCAPMRGDEALEWQRRMLAAMGTTSFPAQGYQLPRAADAAYLARPLPELVALARREQLTHVLTQRAASTPAGTKRVVTSGRFAVYELLPEHADHK